MFGMLVELFRKKKANPKRVEEKYGTIVVFQYPKGPPKKSVKFCRDLYGYDDFSQYGRYSYKRGGFLTSIPHILIPSAKTVIVIKENYTSSLVEFLKSYGAKVYTRRIILQPDDDAKLTAQINEQVV